MLKAAGWTYMYVMRIGNSKLLVGVNESVNVLSL